MRKRISLQFEGEKKTIYSPFVPISDSADASASASASSNKDLSSASPSGGVSSRPQFLSSVPNVTVAVGRNAIIPCVVKNLGNYKVAFVHLDRQMILTIERNVITRIPRFQIHHDNHHTWSLHIENVQKEDKGHYMCQINTDPMLSQIGFVNVVGMKWHFFTNSGSRI